MNLKNIYIIILLCLLASCSSSYSSLEGSGRVYGYSETQIAAETYSLFYLGGSSDTLEKVERHWYFRASELCDNQFKIIEKHSAPLYGKVSIPINGVVTDIMTKRPRINGVITCLK